MNGPEHYRAAEALLESTNEVPPELQAELLAHAQVHATLAMAAAAVDARRGSGSSAVWAEWPAPVAQDDVDPWAVQS